MEHRIQTMSDVHHDNEEVLGGLEQVGAAAEVPAVDGMGAVAEWAGCYPQYAYELVAQITDAEKGTNKKGFWSTYPKEWVKLSSDQQAKARGYFGKLADATKERILTAAKAKSVAPPAAPSVRSTGRSSLSFTPWPAMPIFLSVIVCVMCG